MSKILRKRWNRCFIHDKVLPEYIYKVIGFVVSILSIWYKFLLILERIRTRNNKVPKKYYVSICAIFKDESLSLKEWIEFHLLIGVDHFYLYNNNTTDNSLEILTPYIKKGIVTLIDWNYAPPCQAEAYNHYKEHFSNESNWIAFIDLDEYICPRMNMDLKVWLKQYEAYPSLVIYWKMFGSAGEIEHDKNRLITEQYYIAWDRYCDIGKPIFNTRFTSIQTTIKHLHILPAQVSIFGLNFTIPPINEFKKFVAYRSNRTKLFTHVTDFTIQINHYVSKSYLEYFLTKRRRGDACNYAQINKSVYAYKYDQCFCQVADYSIYKYLPFLKVRMSEGKIENYFDQNN